MNREELMDRLRNPQKYQKKVVSQTQQVTQMTAATGPKKTKQNRMVLLVGVGVFALVMMSLLFIVSAQNRAENVSNALDPNALKGLVVDRTFNPKTEKKVIQISEGQNRNVTVEQSGTTLPVISRYNFRALTDKSYAVIGAAPWALSINVTSNIEDPELLRYLFNQEKLIKGFLARKDVAPYLADPVALAKLATEEETVKAFFAQEAAQQALASEKVVSALAGSRLFSYLLISKAAKYYREHPQDAVRLIKASPTLSALKQNPAVRKAVQENTYLKNIAPTLLK